MADTNKFMLGLVITFVLIGIYSWYDHGRALECRTLAQANGASVMDSVKLCKR